ncbi:MAG: hypothetical protein Q9159_000443 [Coniocarpon cinnabarinum]
MASDIEIEQSDEPCALDWDSWCFALSKHPLERAEQALRQSARLPQANGCGGSSQCNDIAKDQVKQVPQCSQRFIGGDGFVGAEREIPALPPPIKRAPVNVDCKKPPKRRRRMLSLFDGETAGSVCGEPSTSDTRDACCAESTPGNINEDTAVAGTDPNCGEVISGVSSINGKHTLYGLSDNESVTSEAEPAAIDHGPKS